MRDAEVDEELLVCRRFLQRVEVLAVDILDQRVSEERVFLGQTNDRWDRRQARELCRTDTPLAHDDLKAIVLRTYHDRLKNPDRRDTSRKLLQCFLIESAARLLRVRVDSIQRNIDKGRTRKRTPRDHLRASPAISLVIRRLVGTLVAFWLRVARNQRLESTPEATAASH
jgi:hypothetical protein